MRALLLFMPIELLSMLIVVAGLAIVLGAKALGRRLLYLAAAMLMIPAVLAPFFELVPEPLLWLFSVALFVGALFSLFRTTQATSPGRGAAGHTTGNLTSALARWLVWAVAGVIGWALRMLFRGFRTLL